MSKTLRARLTLDVGSLHFDLRMTSSPGALIDVPNEKKDAQVADDEALEKEDEVLDEELDEALDEEDEGGWN